MKKYSILKISPYAAYATHQGITRPQLEWELCLIAQGYGKELYISIIKSYYNIALGFIGLLQALIKQDKAEAEY